MTASSIQVEARRRKGSDADGCKPSDRLHGVALLNPQRFREASNVLILANGTEVPLDASGACQGARGEWYRVAARKPRLINMILCRLRHEKE